MGGFEDDFGFTFVLGDFFEGGEAFGGKPEFLLAGVKGVFGIFEFLEEKPDGGVVVAFDDFFASEKYFAYRVGAAFDGEFFIDGVDELTEGVVYADNFLTFDHYAGD